MMGRKNHYRWQAPRNSNIFDKDFFHNNESKFITDRSLLILSYINNKKIIGITDFEKNIWSKLEKELGIVKNESNIRHFYRPLQFYGFIQEFEK